jgi:LPXTG-motif cell wall-anchored protein
MLLDDVFNRISATKEPNTDFVKITFGWGFILIAFVLLSFLFFLFRKRTKFRR